MADEHAGPLNDDSSLTDVAPVVASWARQQRLVERVYFFGSRVRGDHQPESDLDIAVQLIYPEVDTALAHWTFELDAWVSQLSAILPWELDLQLLAPDGTPTISAGVSRSSVLVYER
ncbi:nucleotidyltransferase family protein [Sulfuriferula sp.]|uniref:nucleotidyltransferase family protein n=1 Tax=Sulfuriferula sp. TaxID=2025307 RepID=UPI0027304535|nr:nucleotidyltransferase domain-containing protein [Sulfuriferula sp.]MDP2026507.1 nucleotidyltransferase domain-containing protein [Sulfuriferula sp.]